MVLSDINDNDDGGKAFIVLCIIIAIANSRALMMSRSRHPSHFRYTHRSSDQIDISNDYANTYVPAVNLGCDQWIIFYSCASQVPVRRKGIVQARSQHSSKLSPDHRQRRGEALGETSTFCHRVRGYRMNATSTVWNIPRSCNL